MAFAPVSTTLIIESDLARVINNTITASQGFETANDIRISAIDTLRHVNRLWSTQSPRSNNTVRTAGFTIDKLHLVYTASQILHSYRDQPNALPAKVIACLTKHIQSKPEVTIGELREILGAIPNVQKQQTAKMEAEKTHIMLDFENLEVILNTAGPQAAQTPDPTQRLEKKRKASIDLSEDAVVSQPPRKAMKKVPTPASDSTGPGLEDIGQGTDLMQKSVRPAPSTPVTKILTKAKKEAKTSSKEDGQKRGSGNWNKVVPTKWYPDEEKFMEDLMWANRGWSYEQYADADTAQFKGTYYTDAQGRPWGAMREGRTREGIRQRLTKLYQEVKADLKANPSEDGSKVKAAKANISKAVASKISPDTKRGSTDDKKRSTGGKKGPMDSKIGTTERRNGSTVVGGKETPAHVQKMNKPDVNMRDSDQAMDEGPVRIYASGTVLMRETEADQTHESGAKGEAGENEPGQDEDPLGDLEEMVARIDAGKL